MSKYFSKDWTPRVVMDRSLRKFSNAAEAASSDQPPRYKDQFGVGSPGVKGTHQMESFQGFQKEARMLAWNLAKPR